MTDYVYVCAVLTDNPPHSPRRLGMSLTVNSRARRENDLEAAVPSSLGSVVRLPLGLLTLAHDCPPLKRKKICIWGTVGLNNWISQIQRK